MAKKEKGVRIQVWIPESFNWIIRALSLRVDAAQVLGGKSTVSNEAKHILEDALKPEYEAVNGRLPESNTVSLTSHTNKQYKRRKRVIKLEVAERYDDVLEEITRLVRQKREAGLNVDFSDELLSLIDEKLFFEKRQIWLDNAEKMGYNLQAVAKTSEIEP